MANAFKSETQTGIGTSAVNILTCPASTEITIIGLTVANIVSTQITVDVQLAAAGRTSGAEDDVYLVKGAPIPAGGTFVAVGGDQKVVMEPGDIIKVTSNTASSADVILSHLDVT